MTTVPASVGETKLVISDIDNTLIDLFNQWGAISRPFLERTAMIFQVETTAILAAAARVDGAQKMHHFPSLIRKALDDRLRRASPVQRQAFEAAAHEWERRRRTETRPYPQVIETIRAIKQSGRGFAIHTDGTVLFALDRLKLAGIPPELIDHLYAQPDAKLGDPAAMRAYLQTSPDPYLQSFAGKVTPLPPGSWKGVDKFDNTSRIVADFHIAAGQALMVGDNTCDAQTAARAGACFAWQEEGACVDQKTADLLMSMDPGYSLGHDLIGRQIAAVEAAQPAGWRENQTVHLEAGFAELTEVLDLPAPEADRTMADEPKLDAEADLAPSL